jgi:hypothetical protein
MGDEWLIDEHQYWYCADHAAELGWCVECRAYVTPDGIYTYDMCADCLELLPEDNADINAAIDDVLAGEPHCPHCESTDVVLSYTEGSGWCNGCDQGW